MALTQLVRTEGDRREYIVLKIGWLQIKILITQGKGNQVRVRISAPREVKISREPIPRGMNETD